MRRATYFAVVFAAVALRGAATDDPAPAPYESKAAYEIYAAVLRLHQTDRPFVVSDTTVPIMQCLQKTGDGGVDAAIEHYKAANEKRWKLKAQDPFTSDLLRSREQIDALKTPDKDGGFAYQVDPAILYLSAVGFNSNGTIAFAEADYVCGGLCGHGSPHIFRKLKGRWERYIPEPKQNPDGTFTFASYCSWAH